MSAPQTARERFEAWLAGVRLQVKSDARFTVDRELTAAEEIFMWNAWQAAERSAIERYTAEMLEKGWRMMPREPGREMKEAVGRHATTCPTMDGKATAWDWTVLHRIAFDSSPKDCSSGE